MITLQKIINDLFENNVEFSVFSDIVGDSTVTTIRLKAETKFSIVCFNGAVCMVKYMSGLIVYTDAIDLTVDDKAIKLELFFEGTHVGVFLCEL